MGLFHVGCTVVNPRTSKAVSVPRVMVDTGAESTWIARDLLERVKIAPRKKDVRFRMANGQVNTRSVGYAILQVNDAETVDEVVFAQDGDLQLLGTRALEGLNLRVDARRKRLVAAGPTIVASAVPERFGETVQVPAKRSKRRPRGRMKAAGQRRPAQRPERRRRAINGRGTRR